MANLKDLLVNGVTRFIGKVYAPTPEAGDNSTQVATTAFVMENAGASGYHPTLFDFKYSDKLLNDIQWLRSDTFSWQDGSVYVAAYNKLVEEYNNSASTTVTEGSITYKLTPSGYKIAASTQENAILTLYNTTGIAWYYILDTTNKRFKLPRMKHKYWKDQSTIPVMGNGLTLGLQDANGNRFGLGQFSSTPQMLMGYSGTYGQNVGTTNTGNVPVAGKSVGVSSDTKKSGVVADVSDVNIETGFYLYFYVGEYTESAVAQTAGLNSELFNGKADLNFNNMNPSQIAKNTIVGWGMPDYSAQIICGSVVNTTLTYECPSKGWVSPDFVSFNGAGYFAINGINIQYRTTSTQYMISHVGLYPVEAGDVVTAHSTYTLAGYLSMNVYFYPCKGAN